MFFTKVPLSIENGVKSIPEKPLDDNYLFGFSSAQSIVFMETLEKGQKLPLMCVYSTHLSAGPIANPRQKATSPKA